MKYKLFDDDSILTEYLRGEQSFAVWFINLPSWKRKLLNQEIMHLKSIAPEICNNFKELEITYANA